MSSAPLVPDLLTFSPSLLEVLPLLSYTDILNCKLVNRRLYTTILSNSHNLPRPTASVHFNTKFNEDKSKMEYIFMFIHLNPIDLMTPRSKTSSATKVLITKHRLRIMHSRKEHSELIKYYIDKGIQQTITSGLPDDAIVEHINNDRSYFIFEMFSIGASAEAPVQYHSLDFEMTNMEETVRELFHLMGSHYHLEMLIDGERRLQSGIKTPEGLLKIMGDAIQNCKGRCTNVNIYMERTGLEEFCDKTNCRSLSVHPQGSLADYLASISNWNRSMIITVDRFDYLPTMVDFIQTWESTSMRIPYRLLLNGSPEWSNQDFVSTLSERLKNISVEHVKERRYSSEETEVVKISVNRTADRAVLEVTYARDITFFIMKDSIDEQ